MEEKDQNLLPDEQSKSSESNIEKEVKNIFGESDSSGEIENKEKEEKDLEIDKKDEEKSDVNEEKEEKEKEIKGDDKEDDVGRPVRPQKYKPLDKYLEEKNKWKNSDKEKDLKIESLQKKISELEPKDKEDIKEDVDKLIDEMGIDEESINSLAKILQKKGLGKIDKDVVLGAIGLSEKDIEELKQAKDNLSNAEKLSKEKEETAHFNKEWEETALPLLESKFPKMNANEKKLAFKLMDELAHSKKYHLAELDEIFYAVENKEKSFSKLMSNPKKGLESSSNSGADIQETENERPDIMSMTPKQLQEYELKREKEMSKSGNLAVLSMDGEEEVERL